MEKAFIGKKLGMTQVFTSNGGVVAVTVLETLPMTVLQIKTKKTDGYDAIVVGSEEKRKNLVNKPEAGLFKKANTTAKKVVKELRLDNIENYKVGDTISCEIFAEGDVVDVTSNTKGRGFTGVIQRWNASRLKETHGTGPVHRHVGSMGANSCPSRVFKNKHMAGQYGNEQVTIQNLEVVKVDKERNCVLVKGGVPGARGNTVMIKNAVKQEKKN